MNGQPWSAEDVATLVRMYPDHSAEDVARALNRSAKAVITKAHYLDVRHSARWLSESRREIARRPRRAEPMVPAGVTHVRPGLIVHRMGR